MSGMVKLHLTFGSSDALEAAHAIFSDPTALLRGVGWGDTEGIFFTTRDPGRWGFAADGTPLPHDPHLPDGWTVAPDMEKV